MSQSTIMVASASSLVHLAQAGALHLLQAAGRAVFVMDLTVIEAVRAADASSATLLDRWVQQGNRPDCRPTLTVEVTELGHAVRLALKTDPRLTFRKGGETANVGWLVERLHTLDGPVIILHAGERLQRIVTGQGWDDRVVFMQTSDLLSAAARRLAVSASLKGKTDAERLKGLAALACQETATARISELVWLLRLAGYGDMAECRALLGDTREWVTWSGQRLLFYIGCARKRLLRPVSS